MGACTSKQKQIVQQADPPPHPSARKIWLVAAPLDSQQIPLDLAGIDHDGLRSAMKNRGMETEHWALKVDRAQHDKGAGTVFDINLEGSRMIASTGDVNSPYWKAISRRVPLGWTIWTDNEIASAVRQLIQARPKYNGRQNNFHQLAQILARHIEFKPLAAAAAANNGSSSSPGASKAGLPSSPSQLTDLSGQPSDSNESSDQAREAQHVASVRSNRHSRPPMARRPSSERDTGERPSLGRSAMSEQQASRLQASRDRSSFQRPSPLNPEKHRSMTGPPLIDLGGGGGHPSRTRSQSDVSQWNQLSVYDSGRRRESVLGSSQEGRRQSMHSGQNKRHSQVPAEWQGEASRANRRESQLLFVPNTWGPAHGSPSQVGPYDMGMMGMPPVQPWAYGGGHSASMTSLHRPMLPHPASFYGPPGGGMPWMSSMPMLVPPSPGYGSMHSSLVPTPPESPHLMAEQTKSRLAAR